MWTILNYIFEIEILLSVHFWLWNRMWSMDRKTQYVKYIFASLICTQYWSKTFCFPKISHLFLFTFWADTSILSASKTAEKGYFTQTAESFTQFTPGRRYHNFSLILEMATLGDRQDVKWLTKETRSYRSTRTTHYCFSHLWYHNRLHYFSRRESIMSIIKIRMTLWRAMK